ncbi:uncharacterized protein LOC119360681 [Triticum dicoccoides]|uniref:uncharacterized protein LOC119360681 n=1 Tax=Triticum dicoccoides TaxID=85692 RepID=UPI0018908F3D|nr:uncharacterized protein LOC119360681 [Triticum dicoccoides]
MAPSTVSLHCLNNAVYRGEGVCWGGIWFAPGWGLLRLAAAWPVGARVRDLSVRVVSVAAGCGSLIRRCCVVMLWHSLGCFNLVSRPLLLVRGRSGGLHLAQPGVRGVAALYKGRDDLGTAWRFFGFARWLSSMCPDGSGIHYMFGNDVMLRWLGEAQQPDQGLSRWIWKPSTCWHRCVALRQLIKSEGSAHQSYAECSEPTTNWDESSASRISRLDGKAVVALVPWC